MSKIGERAGLEVSRSGPIVDQAEQLSAPVGELIGLAVAIIVLTLVFSSVAAMLLTLLASLIALAGGILLLRFGAAFTDFPSFAPTLGVMLGLGAGIDYSLLIVGRYREQLASGDSVQHSARVANATAGTSVVAAGAIVVVAIAGLLATGIPFVGRMGVGSAIVVASVAVGAVTVLPTLWARSPGGWAQEPADGRAAQGLRALGDLHHQAPAAPPRSPARSSCSRSPPRSSACASACPTTATTPGGTTTRVAYDRLAEGFGVGFNGPLVLATDHMGALEQTSRDDARTPPASPTSQSRSRARRTPRRSPSSRPPLPGPADERPRHPPA